MKNTILIPILLLTINCLGQVNSEKIDELKSVKTETIIETDTAIKVVYNNKIENNRKPAYYINKKIVNESVLRTINPKEIESVNVEKGDFQIDNSKYVGKIIIETKDNYRPMLISLNSLKAKYIKPEEKPTIFKIDNAIVNADYDSFMIDEKFILKIIVEKFENKEEKLNLLLVNLITKTEENIKKSKEIRIRGKDEFAIDK